MKFWLTAVSLPFLLFFGLMNLLALSSHHDVPVSPEIVDACTGVNLLSNPSFEGDYTAYILPPPGHPDCQTVDPNEPNQFCRRIQMPTDWHPFWRDNPRDDPTMNILPEYKPGELWETPPRVNSGERSQHYFSFYSTHEAGMYQQVTAVPGGQYCFSAWGQAWSANTTLPDYTSTDDHGFLYQKIGIDPTGGTDWQSPNVVWSEARLQYDVFGQFMVQTTAVSSTMTVFLHSRPQWPVKHNDVYWDDAHLTVNNEMVVTAVPLGLVTAVDNPATVTQTVGIVLPDGFAWSASLDAAGTITPDLSVVSGTTSIDMQISVSSAGLSTGAYTNTVTIAAPGTVGGPVSVPIQVRVAPEVWQMYLPGVAKP